jgi:type III secretory pathway component EscT
MVKRFIENIVYESYPVLFMGLSEFFIVILKIAALVVEVIYLHPQLGKVIAVLFKVFLL